MANTKIEWAEKVWNPITGCSKISEGCKFCYAERQSYRNKGMKQEKYSEGFNLRTHPSALEAPCHWKKSSIIFANSMSDMFHEKLPIEYIHKVFKVINDNPQHIFLVLTKRADIMERLSPELTWTKNIWMGVTVESNKYYDRIDSLRNTGAKFKFLSLEPLLSSVSEIQLDGIDWVIVGGESGSNSRPLQKEWVVEIKDKCEELDIPFFFKQWGGFRKKEAGCLLDGKEYKAMPDFETSLGI